MLQFMEFVKMLLNVWSLKMNKIIENLKGKLIVSCQAYPGEPMRCSETMAQIAEAAVRGGASAIRCQGLNDIELIKKRVSF